MESLHEQLTDFRTALIRTLDTVIVLCDFVHCWFELVYEKSVEE